MMLDRGPILGGDVLRLHALARVGERGLKGAVGDRKTLHADREAGRVHHDEHVLEALVLFADQVSDRAALFAVVNRARRRRMDSQLVLDGGAYDVVALAERAVGIDVELRHDEERDALDAFGRRRRARQHEVHDVGRVVVLAVRDEDLLSAETEMVAFGDGLRANLREVRTGLGFGEVHRAGPFARDQLRNELLFLLVGPAQQDRFDRALIEQRPVGECHVGGLQHLERRGRKHLRQA